MSVSSKYREIFQQSFQHEQVETLKYQDIPAWDSVGHMGLVAALEDEFEIEMEIDDIIDMSSFDKGKEILAKYGVIFDG
jgi:acyl carrier protein